MTKESMKILRISSIERARKIAKFIEECEEAGISIAQDACLIESGNKVYLLANQNHEDDN